ncbi:MAG: redox-sensing transcriptional repressor Rex [Ruminococcaceae bacterium]|nr:redox-sensing transcriptional repressor Rex [Oscillospiraceae bacterium]
MAKQISMPVIRRLPRYHRFLSELESQGVERISSNQLASIMRSTASQIRQDLNCFGGFGQQGYGYPVSQLKEEIGKILGLDKKFNAILLGAGNLGKAVATHMNFSRQGFELTAVFDKSEEIVGTMLRGITIMSDDEIERYCHENKIDAAFLCLPRNSVKPLIDKLYSLGIKNFWNFSHYDIKNDYKDVIVENVHMSDSLMTLCYRINESYNN